MTNSANDTKEWGTTLVVATAGHVWLARGVTFDGTFYHLTDARIVRRWGTSNGLNQLIDGPQKETVLDAPAPLVTVVSQAMLALIPCREGAWK